MAWHAQLRVDYAREGPRSVARFNHTGPLRILQSLYPEGGAICHNVLVHPPSGLVGGDTLALGLQCGAGTHAVLTTPGATRFYRSDGAPAVQQVQADVAAGARLEWLPLEAICYSGCIAENHLQLRLAPGAEAMGWDVVALGLPAANQPFVQGSLLQHLELPGAWLERGRIAAGDAALLDGPLGLAGQRCMATLFFACGTAIDRARRDALLGLAREVIESHPLAATAGATAPGPQLLVVRVLAPLVEPAMALLRAVRAAWRPAAWELAPTVPRTWAL